MIAWILLLHRDLGCAVLFSLSLEFKQVRITMNKILIIHEKRGDRYFDASTPELLNKAAFDVLKERLEAGWYDFGDQPQKKTLSECMGSDQIVGLSAMDAERIEDRLHEIFVRQHDCWRSKRNRYNEIKSAIQNKKTSDAFYLLDNTVHDDILGRMSMVDLGLDDFRSRLKEINGPTQSTTNDDEHPGVCLG